MLMHSSEYYWQKVCMYKIQTLFKLDCHKFLELIKSKKISITLRILYTIKMIDDEW